MEKRRSVMEKRVRVNSVSGVDVVRGEVIEGEVKVKFNVVSVSGMNGYFCGGYEVEKKGSGVWWDKGSLDIEKLDDERILLEGVRWILNWLLESGGVGDGIRFKVEEWEEDIGNWCDGYW